MTGYPHTSPDASLHGIVREALGEAESLAWRSGLHSLVEGQCPLAGYQILKRLGTGGQAEVFLGVEEHTGRSVAIKVYALGPGHSGRDLRRFEREVEALQSISHPGIAAIHHAEAHDGRAWLVTEYIPGWNLDDYLREHDLDSRETVLLLAQIAAAVHAAHLKGIIHRDLKPSNIRVDQDGRAHLIDFGLARPSAPGTPQTVSATGDVVGTLPWLSPEQADGRNADVDVRTDVYALGLIGYHMLTDELPYDTGGPVREVLQRIASDQPKRPRRYQPHLERDVETILLVCLEKDPARRYQTAAAVLQDLQFQLEGRPITARRDSVVYHAWKSAAYHWRITLPACVFAFLLVGGGAVYSWHERTLRRSSERTVDTLIAFVNARSTLDTPKLASEEESVIRTLIDEADRLGPASARPAYEVRAAIARKLFICRQFARAVEQQVLAMNAAGHAFGFASREYLIATVVCARYALDAGSGAQAVALSEQALAITDSAPYDAGTLAAVYGSRAWIALHADDPATAEDMVRRWLALVMEERADGALAVDLKSCAEMLYDVAGLPSTPPAHARRLLDEALHLQNIALSHARTAYAAEPERKNLAHNLNSIASLLNATGRPAEAEPYARQALAIRSRELKTSTLEGAYLYSSMETLAVCRLKQGAFTEAQHLLDEAYIGCCSGDIREFADTRQSVAGTAARLHQLWAWADPDAGHQDEALRWLARSLE